MKKWFMCIALATLCLLSSMASAITPPPADDVFQAEVKPVDPNSFFITWKIKAGYFLYADRIQLSVEQTTHFTIGSLQFPPTLTKTDRLGHTYPVYRDELVLPVPVLGQQTGSSFLSIAFQGCADDGFCYPPETRRVQLTIDNHLALTDVKIIQEYNNVISSPNKTITNNPIATVFSSHHWSATLLLFFGLGLLLSFTPCVLPMIPVLSGIIVGHEQISTQKAFGLSLSYVLSMAFTYALIGVTVALLGENLQITMYSPLIISLFSGLFVVLALSMFGLFDLKLPISWQAKLAEITRKQSSGHYISAAIMGSLSTLVLSPCVTAPLVGALGYIAESGDLFLGGGALFTMGLGMGVPLLIIGTSAGKWLPKAGIWMNAVKSFFGFLLLALAIYLLTRILPATLMMALWAMLFIFAGIYAGALLKGQTHQEKLKQSVGIILLVYGLILLIGASLGNHNPLQPLENLSLQTNTIDSRFKTRESELIVTNSSELQTALSNTKGKPVMLDFYADWCTSCKVMEATTLRDPILQKALEKIVVIKVDVTHNTASQQALLKDYQVIAPPTFIFINSQGHEVSGARLVGEVSSQDFITQLANI